MNQLSLAHNYDEHEEAPLFDRILADVKLLRKLAFKMNDGSNFESDVHVYFNLVNEIKSVETKLTDTTLDIDEQFIYDILDQLIEIRFHFDQLIENQTILEDAIHALRINSFRVVQWDTREIPEPKKLTYSINIPDDIVSDFAKVLKETESNVWKIHPKNTPSSPEISLDNLIPWSVEILPSTERIPKILRDDTFTNDGKFRSEKWREMHRTQISRILGNSADQVRYWQDCREADRVSIFNKELDDDLIQKLKQDIIKRKDGEFAQAIKNNLIKHAANDDNFDPNTCRSLMLAEHIKNLTPKNPITIHTVEFGICKITSVKTVDYWDECYYEICMLGANGGESYLRIRASAFIVWDLSNKIIWQRNKNGKWNNISLPCTIRHIRSTVSEKKLEPTSFKDRTTNFIKKWFGEIKNIFGFWKKNRN
jgi:hypothetical protein